MGQLWLAMGYVELLWVTWGSMGVHGAATGYTGLGLGLRVWVGP